MESTNHAFTRTGPTKPVGSRAGSHSHSLKAWWR